MRQYYAAESTDSLIVAASTGSHERLHDCSRRAAVSHSLRRQRHWRQREWIRRATYPASITNGLFIVERNLAFRTISNAATASTAWLTGSWRAVGAVATAGSSWSQVLGSTAAVAEGLMTVSLGSAMSSALKEARAVSDMPSASKRPSELSASESARIDRGYP